MLERYYKVIACILIILVCGFAYLFMDHADSSQTDTQSEPGDDFFTAETEESAPPNPPGQEEIKKSDVFIHIGGEVKKPGVYRFSYEPRLVEVIHKAGGLTKRAAAESINQAQLVADGMQIIIADKKQAKRASAGESASLGDKQDTGSLVNINSAGKEELMTLTGIGESKAVAVIQYREENGGFQRKEDIMKISGIKEATYEKLKDLITV